MTNLFLESVIEEVWNKAKIIPTYDPSEWRQDVAGAWIRRFDYGDRESCWGWEIDHIKPLALNGTDVLNNLQPLQWENNVAKCDDFPSWWAKVSSFGGQFIYTTKLILQ